MTKFLNLEEAAKLLGMSADELVEARSNGEVHGYRDGSSWKFKEEEIQRFAAERQGNAASDEDDLLGGSGLFADDDDAILVSEEELGSSESASSTIIGSGRAAPDADDMTLAGGDSDLKLAGEPDTGSDVLGGPPAPKSIGDSDVQLMPDPEGSDVKVVAGGSSNVLGAGSDELKLDLSSGSGTGELRDTGGSSDFGLDDDEEVLSLSDEDDLVLASGSGTGSDITMGGSDTGINLASPSDSGLLLEDDALDLGSVSSLELPEDIDETIDVGSGVRPDDEFNLGPPSAGGAPDDEGSSQVIELGGDDAFGTAVADADPFAANDVFTPIDAGEGLAEISEEPVAVGAPGAPEPQFSAFNVAWLSVMALMLVISGVLMVDVVRNMWAWNDATSQSVASSISEGLISAVGLLNR